MKYLFIIFIALISLETSAQLKISGDVKDETGAPVPFATVYLDETFEGASSDIDGKFIFEPKATGTYTLVVSAVGFETVKQPVAIENEPLILQLILKGTSQMLDPVVISAGSFDASDKAKSTMFKPMDIVMNAGAQGDIFKAIETLPGVSKVGEETGLFVRGGDAHETKTIIDGAIVEKPFYSETPNVASRSRFDPFMFKGTTFTTGGYSSEYGGALSSILLLETEDIPESTSSGMGINMAGITLSHQQVWNEKTAVMAGISYNNTALLFKSVPQNVDWVKPPEGLGTKGAFRHKTKNGMFKSLLQHQRGKIGLNTTNFEEPQNPHEFKNENRTTYWNTNYKGTITKKLGMYAGFALNHSKDEISYDGQTFGEESRILHVKTTFYYDAGSKTALKFGAESFMEDDAFTAATTEKLQDQYSAAFAESDMAVGERLALRLGVRSEHSAYLDKLNVAPRTSMAYKTGKNSQVSLAYGLFYQKPEDEFLLRNSSLDFERSTHLIANYQWGSNGRSFRAEVYDKRYQNLVKVTTDGILTNKGDGYSRGLDIFWKDAKTIRNLDYWVSYSYIDAERDYKNYPLTATPGFVTDHTLNFVATYDFKNIGLRPGITYTFASGRRYVNPNNENFLTDKTKDYHNVTLNLSYVTQVFNKFAVLYGSFSNPFGFDQVFGYEYSADGTKREAVRPAAKRTFFLGLFMNF